MPRKNFLAFDLGAESGRAVLGTLEGGKLTLEEKHRFSNPTGRINGHLHWNLLQQWEELKTGLRKTAGSEAGTKVELDGIGVDTWGVDFGLLNVDGDVLGFPFMYRDARTDGVMEETFKRTARAEIFDATGIQFMQFNTLFQLLAMKAQNPALLQQATSLLLMPDLFNFLFTGVRKTEFSIASTTQMYDPRKKAWATDLLKKLDLPAQILTDIVPSGTLIGNVQKTVADEVGLTSEVPVIAPGGHDTASAVAAVPFDETTEKTGCYISSGTWSLMGVELDEPIISAKSLELNYTNEGGVGGKIRFLKNIMGLWLVQECRRAMVKAGHDHSYTELTQMAARAKAFGPVVDPNHRPFLSPGDMPQKIDTFCKMTKQNAPATRGETIRCCLESLALTYRKTVEGLEQILGRRIEVIHIVGGGTQNELLNQMTADACKRPVIAGPIEATAIGNILVQAMAVGAVKTLGDARKIVRDSFPVKRYEPSDPAAWDEAYTRYEHVVGH